MKAEEIRKKYIEFFKASPRSHKEISPSPLVLEGDSTTLFTSAGMQQLVPYLSGKKHPKGNRLVNSQPSLRTQDIDEVGNSSHTTFFEMLGNWSLGDYFKEDQLAWFWEFLTKELDLSKERLWVSIFKGDKEVPRDDESFEVWRKLGIPENKIFEYGVNENWWSMTGAPSQMTQGDIGGPDSEVFFEFTQVKHDSEFGKKCHPNCQCGRFLEIGNSVFIQYTKREDGSLEELAQKNVDFGGGLERLAAATEDSPDLFNVDLLKNTILGIEKNIFTKYNYEDKNVKPSFRVLADHMRASIFLIEEGIEPSNKTHGYTLRRLLRRSVMQKYKWGSMNTKLSSLVEIICDSYANTGYFSSMDRQSIKRIINDEEKKFIVVLEKALSKWHKLRESKGRGIGPLGTQKLGEGQAYSAFTPMEVFNFITTYGLPEDIIRHDLGWKGDWKQVEKLVKKHKDKSRSTSSGMFKGGLADASEEVVQLHTATHLLHWALREVLGKSVRQEGSNITKERLRFDFVHKQKLSEKELKKVENLINQKIKEGLPVHKSIETKEEALKSGALAFFKETYPEKVSVYTIGKDSQKDWVSKELCGGPHVKSTSEIGRVNITKQDKIGSGLIRVYAVAEKN